MSSTNNDDDDDIASNSNSKPSADPSSSVDRADEDAVQPPRLTLGLFDIVSTVRMLSNLGVAKTKVNPAQGLLLGWQATAYLAFAAFVAWMIMSSVSADISTGLGQFLGFIIFGSSALVLVILYGSNLVTGDFMTSGISLMTGQAKWREVLWEWSIAHSGHWMSGFIISWMIVIGASQAGVAGSDMMNVLAGIGNTKVNGYSWIELFFRGIFANWLIAMGVWGAYRTKEFISKIFLIGIPVGVFFAIGFEHSIVNHFALSAGIWAGGDYTWGQAWFNNLVPVTFGNIIGAMIFQGMVYWYIGGMQRWKGPNKWKLPHGSYKDLVHAIRDTWTLMLFFVGMAPLMAGAVFLFVVEPMLGILPNTNDQNFIVPIGIALYLVVTALIVKWRFMPKRKWYDVPDS